MAFLGRAKYAAEDDLEYAMHQMVSLAAFMARAENRPEKEATIKEILLSDTQNTTPSHGCLTQKGEYGNSLGRHQPFVNRAFSSAIAQSGRWMKYGVPLALC